MSESKKISHHGRTEKANRRLNAGHPGVYKAKQLHDKREEAKLEAREDRIGMADGRAPGEQLARLDTRLGAGLGARRERHRLTTMIASQQGSQEAVEGVKPSKLTRAEKLERKARKFAQHSADLKIHNTAQTAGK